MPKGRVVGWLGGAGLVLLFAGAVASLVTRRPAEWSGWVGIAGLALLLLWALARGERIAAFLAGRAARRGANAAASIILVLVLVSLVEALGTRHAHRFDLTRGKQFSLSPQTKKILHSLDRDVEAVAFYKETTPDRDEFEDLLDEYAKESPRFTYRFVDPDRDPSEAKRYDVNSYGTTVLVTPQREERVYGTEEEELTNALVKVTHEGKEVFYFLTGHGEHGIDSQEHDGLGYLRKALERDNFVVKDLLLLREPAVPADAGVVVVAGPTSDLLQPEISALQAYLEKGGKMLVLVDPGPLPRLAAFLRTWGVVLGDDVVIDTMSRIFGGDSFTPIVSQYAAHEITRDFSLASFFPLARSVDLADPLPDGLKGVRLAFTGEDAWGETDLAKALEKKQATFDEGKDIKGPVPVAVVVTKTLADSAASDSSGAPDSSAAADTTRHDEMRLVVFGDSDFVTNASLTMSGNANLALNTTSWLAEEEDLVAIRPKNPAGTPLLLSAVEGRLVFALPVVVLPLTLLGIGISVTARRRWRR